MVELLVLTAILVVLLVVVGIFAHNVLPSTRDRFARRLAAAPEVPIAAAQGLCRLRGTVEPGALIEAPLSGRPCVAFLASVSTPGVGENGWRVLATEIHAVAFGLRDSSGRASVEALREGVIVNLTADHVERPGTAAPSPRARQLLERHDLLGWRGELRFAESIVAPAETVVVAGHAAPRNEGGYRESEAPGVVVRARPRAPLLISDAAPPGEAR